MSIYQSYFGEYQKRIMSYAPLAIIGQSCLGSVAAMYILINGNTTLNMVQLFIVTILCMFYNGAILSQQKPKISFNLLIASVVVSSILIIINA
ncbi:hypothetical protein [Spongiimicrobium salis]|uniref:hypothetical protein n=1 Tax=Spongiimicrobium salis TaxID=1667022 RepID=UPI00374CAF9E